MRNINPRRVALNILVDIEKNKAFSNIAINKYIKKQEISSLDRRFISQLVYGVLENKLYLDYIIKNLSKTKINKIEIDILNILRLGLYQIIFLAKIPDSAAVNESVKMAKKINFRLSGFVNGLLRSFIRNKDNINLPSYEDSPSQYLSVKYSHPEWLVDRWISEYGYDFTRELLESNNKTPNLTIRTNTLKINRDNLIGELIKEGVVCRKGELSPESVIIESMKSSLDNLKSFKNGLFQVQDESSMLVGHALDPLEGDFIVDVCSAPGGKSTHIAQLMKNKGRILSRDIHEHKLDLIKENANRLDVSIIDTEKFDATKLDKKLVNLADRVIVDAPCSGFGIIRRKPEIRYFKDVKDIVELSKLQIKILDTSSNYVKKGGVLVYSTCTIMEEENKNIIKEFLRKKHDFTLLDINMDLPKNLFSEEKYMQIYPNVLDADGFFICKMKRVK
ncbi:16S rRNA (cytosine(967)-C(5))-methyltransferase RsmB [Paramaledivibacter caminithermalis]|jgi:16S rRNA (cytosine967-C5)-methyltransferase|uniref:16S rRNA (cytosine(967)-C(5))-methyltransferase n=1 Tax=Paramaledivibacter caminithermalis (strain DSM 15212 / CIP 107654 / DViRD3) TaxID=1121301 RepID=A0A1M6NHS4_PARC5|nr:16S rRNA (cytosine(967)-C(5))-methyltransferase RsmB [Paramaledivibacter caminithermalis]SHJ95164.1 NusB antitermination factor [Paramaledivibacter caminithermalis DSM 15212]